MNESDTASKEQIFAKGVDAAKVIVEKLKPYCQTLDELASILEHASQNTAQLRLLLATVTGPGQQSRR